MPFEPVSRWSDPPAVPLTVPERTICDPSSIYQIAARVPVWCESIAPELITNKPTAPPLSRLVLLGVVFVVDQPDVVLAAAVLSSPSKRTMVAGAVPAASHALAA